MKEPIKMTGRLLVFDQPSLNDVKFPSDCKLTFPEKVPVVREFDVNNPNAVLGNGTVQKDEKGLVCEVTLLNFDREVLREYFQDTLYIGGYYNKVKMGVNRDGITIIEEANLVCIGTTFTPADPDMRMVVKKEDKETED